MTSKLSVINNNGCFLKSSVVKNPYQESVWLCISHEAAVDIRAKTAVIWQLPQARRSAPRMADWQGHWQETLLPHCWLAGGLRSSLCGPLRLLRSPHGKTSGFQASIRDYQKRKRETERDWKSLLPAGHNPEVRLYHLSLVLLVRKLTPLPHGTSPHKSWISWHTDSGCLEGWKAAYQTFISI